jgi:DsbC/DsbD-like thiol-disulfide interchange protein
MRNTTITAFVLGCLAAAPLFAEDTFRMPVKGDILSGWVQSDGTRVAGLRLKLAPGWKTYWRTPGDAGIPPQFDWSGSENLRGVGVTWPTPVVFLTAGMRTIGYEGDVVFPIALAPHQAGQAITLNATIDIGVCSDICVPHRMTLKAELADSNTKPTPAIAAALAARPYSASEAGVTSATCALSPSADGLMIKATLGMPSAGGSEVVIIEPGQQGLWMSETKTTRSGDTLVAVGEMMASDGRPVAIKRSDVKITVLGKTHAVEISGCAPG